MMFYANLHHTLLFVAHPYMTFNQFNPYIYIDVILINCTLSIIKQLESYIRYFFNKLLVCVKKLQNIKYL